MIRRLRLDKYSALYLWAIFMVFFGITKRSTFLSVASVKLVFIEAVFTAVLALAFLVPLSTGTFDLSIGTMMSMSLVISAYLAKHHVVNPIIGMFIALAACAVAGAISGFFVVKLKVNSFIATLGMSQIITAFIVHTSPQSINSPFGESFQNLGKRQIFGVPLFMIYLAAIALVLWYVFEHTPMGRYMFATGGNPEAARLAGVRTDRLVFGSLIASAVIAGFAGTIYSWRIGNYAQSVGPGYLFAAIAAVFFGASQLKGRPNVWGTLIALYALAWGIKGLQLTFSGAQNWIEPLFTGLSLLAAVSLASRAGIIKVPKRAKPAVAADTSGTEAAATASGSTAELVP
jgi:ribose transport system permease protein